MIHYHGAPFGATTEEIIRALRGKHACISLEQTRQLPQLAEICQSFILDNGAFTAWKRGERIELHASAARWSQEATTQLNLELFG